MEFVQTLGIVRRALALPIFAFIVEFAVALPKADHDIERLFRHLPVLAAEAVDIEQSPIGRNRARADADIAAPLRNMIEPGDAVGELRRMMIVQHVAAR